MNEEERKNHGNRWTTERFQELIGLWLSGRDTADIAAHFGITQSGINKVVLRLRANGVPLPLRKRGHKAGRRNKPWTQEEVEAVVRSRAEGASTAEISALLDRTFFGVHSMIMKLRSEEGIPIRNLAHGRHRLWDAERLRASIAGRGLRVVGDE